MIALLVDWSEFGQNLAFLGCLALALVGALAVGASLAEDNLRVLILGVALLMVGLALGMSGVGPT